LKIRNISKAFPNVQALDDVSLDIRFGEILAFIGENGAGKSTLLKIINGDYQADSGSMSIDGEPLNFSNPRDAHEAGVRVIYQEPEIIPGVDVAENIWVGELPKRFGLLDRRQLNEQVRMSLKEYGFEKVLPMGLMGDQLSTAQAQIVEIMRALKSGVRVLALDEPTSSLTDDEVNRLFTLIRRLRDEGVAIIYVSHRLQEIMGLCDRVAIMRDGLLQTVQDTNDLSESEMIRIMVGRKISDVFRRNPAVIDRKVLEVKDLHSNWHRGISFHINAGEVVGFSGLVGAGRSELAKVIFGSMPKTQGKVFVEGKEVSIHSPNQAIKEGIGFAPEDRKNEGLILIRSVLENTSIAIMDKITKFHFVQNRKERLIAKDFVEKLNVVTPSLEQLVGKLSGGNQQKVVLARWLAARPKVLILDEPTRGIDVGAKVEIYRLIDDLANEGMGIMLINSELPEILGLSDRIYVMQNGRITGEVSRENATEDTILELSMLDDLSITSEKTNHLNHLNQVNLENLG